MTADYRHRYTISKRPEARGPSPADSRDHGKFVASPEDYETDEDMTDLSWKELVQNADANGDVDVPT